MLRNYEGGYGRSPEMKSKLVEKETVGIKAETEVERSRCLHEKFKRCTNKPLL